MLTLNKTFTLLGPDGKPYSSATPGTFGGHRAGKLYGRLDCRAALQAIVRGGYVHHRVFFADEATAMAAGYRPCAVCMPQEYAAWKKNDIEAFEARVGSESGFADWRDCPSRSDNAAASAERGSAIRPTVPLAAKFEAARKEQ